MSIPITETAVYVVSQNGARQSRLRESAQGDKWSFCLTAGKIWPANQERA
jgi:hypothetical protein